MKKIALFFAAFAALFFVACSNEVEETTPHKSLKDIKININVSNYGETGTRAAKKSWVAGDKLNLWFRSWNPGKEDHTPQLVLTYDGTKWTAGSFAPNVVLETGPNKAVIAVYEGFNDLSRYFNEWYMGYEWFHPTGYSGYGKFSCNAYASPMVICCGTDYSFDGETLTLNLSDWYFETKFKVLIKNMPAGTASNFELQTINATTGNKAGAKGAWIVMPAQYYLGTGSANYSGVNRGVEEPDGIAFYYSAFAADDQTITFTLWDGTQKKTYTVDHKTVVCEPTKCVGVVLDYNNFVAE